MAADKYLRDEWCQSFPFTLFIDDEFYRYNEESGLWEVYPDIIIRREVAEVIEASSHSSLTNALVTSVMGLVKTKCAKARKRPFDKKPNLLACKNGTLDVFTRQLSLHKHDNFLTSGVGFNYDAEAQAPAWISYLAYLESVMPGIPAFLQEYAGLCATIETKYEIALWLYGPPGCGKSTFIEGLLAALKDRSFSLGLADLDRSQFALTNLPGKTLAIATEQPSRNLRSTHTLNCIISGEDVQVERKYHHPMPVAPRCKLVWAMNTLPTVTESNNGIFRRTAVVSFPVLPDSQRNPLLKERIKVEGPGILNWCLDGLDRLLKRGKFFIPEHVQEASRAFREANDIENSFVAEFCEKGPLLSEGSSTLYSAYSAWCKETGHKVKSMTIVAIDWERLGFKSYTSNGYRRWKGLKLKHPDLKKVESSPIVVSCNS